MSLVFKVLQSPGGSMDNQAFSVAETGATIGYLPHNDIVLPNDPSIAKQHAMIQFQGGSFRLFDTSHTGVYLNNSVTPINATPSIFIELHDNDILRMGQYLMQVNKDDNTITQTNTDLDIDALLSNDRSPILSAERHQLENASSYGSFSGSELYDDLGVNRSFSHSTHISGEFNIDDFLSGELDKQQTPEKSHEFQDLLGNQPAAEEDDFLASFIDQDSTKKASSFNTDEPIDLDDLLSGGSANNDQLVDDIKIASTPMDQYTAEPFVSNIDECFDLLVQQLDLGHLKIENKVQFTENIAFLLKSLIHNVIQANRQRRHSQKQLQIQSRALDVDENNPIAYANDPKDALTKLLLSKTQSEIENAVTDCFVKQTQYEADLFVATQEAFVDYLEKFSPHLVDGIMKSEIDVKRGIFRVKRRNFKHYVTYYRDILDQAKHGFSSTIGKRYQPGAGKIEHIPEPPIEFRKDDSDADAEFSEETKN